MNVSAKGNPARHDSDASCSVAAPTARLQRALQISSVANVDKDTRMSTESTALDESFPSTSSVFHQISGLEMSTESSALNESFPSTSSAFHQISGGDASSGHSQSQSDQNPNMGSSQPVPPKRPRVDYSGDIHDILMKQQENNELQTKYLELAVDRAEIAKRRELLLLQKPEIDVQTSQECQRIEIEKKRRRELNL